MATRAENAEALKKALGTEIDTSKSDPKADLLQGWADRLESDQEGVRKEVLTWQLQNELDVEIPSGQLTAEQLQGFLDQLAQGTDPEQVAAQLRRQAAQPAPPATTSGPEGDTTTVAATPDPQAEEITVQVVGRTAAYGGAYTDPVSKKTLTGTPTSVPRTAFVEALLATGELAEAK